MNSSRELINFEDYYLDQASVMFSGCPLFLKHLLCGSREAGKESNMAKNPLATSARRYDNET